MLQVSGLAESQRTVRSKDQQHRGKEQGRIHGRAPFYCCLVDEWRENKSANCVSLRMTLVDLNL